MGKCHSKQENIHNCNDNPPDKEENISYEEVRKKPIFEGRKKLFQHRKINRSKIPNLNTIYEERSPIKISSQIVFNQHKPSMFVPLTNSDIPNSRVFIYKIKECTQRQIIHSDFHLKKIVIHGRAKCHLLIYSSSHENGDKPVLIHTIDNKVEPVHDNGKDLIEISTIDTFLHKDDVIYVRFVMKGGHIDVEMIEEPTDNHKLQIVNLEDKVHFIPGKIHIDFLGIRT
jgi:hypothetical protein